MRQHRRIPDLKHADDGDYKCNVVLDKFNEAEAFVNIKAMGE